MKKQEFRRYFINKEQIKKTNQKMRKGEYNLCQKKALKTKILKKPNKSLFDYLMYYIINF